MDSYTIFHRAGSEGKHKHWPVVTSQMLLFVTKCIHCLSNVSMKKQNKMEK